MGLNDAMIIQYNMHKVQHIYFYFTAVCTALVFVLKANGQQLSVYPNGRNDSGNFQARAVVFEVGEA